jgi:leucyl/phenylalanyl-tRNA--protein transferase
MQARWTSLGLAHSVETWESGQLVGGLYGVCLGRMFFGESMFTRRTDASKIALAVLVRIVLAEGIAMIDCQQNTSHLALMGAGEVTRADFLSHIKTAQVLPPVNWDFDPLYWFELTT